MIDTSKAITIKLNPVTQKGKKLEKFNLKEIISKITAQA